MLVGLVGLELFVVGALQLLVEFGFQFDLMWVFVNCAWRDGFGGWRVVDRFAILFVWWLLGLFVWGC